MKLGFIGTGHMGGALVEGFSKTPYNDIIIYNRRFEHSKLYQENYHCTVAASLSDLIQQSDIIFLTTPARSTLEVMAEIKSDLREEQIIISCAAGVELSALESAVDYCCPVVRAIPNIPVNVNAGAITLVFNKEASPATKDDVKHIFKAVGESIELEESLLNVASSIAGCSPAFISVMIEAMVDAGVYYGCSNEQALTLSLLALKGTAETLIQKQLAPSTLKYQVASPKGDTIKGLLALEEHGFKHAMIQSIIAATGDRE